MRKSASIDTSKIPKIAAVGNLYILPVIKVIFTYNTSQHGVAREIDIHGNCNVTWLKDCTDERLSSNMHISLLLKGE
jgi:hypothetical protein